MAELSHRDITFGELLAGREEGYMRLAGDAVGNALLGLLACVGGHLVEAVVLGDRDTQVVGSACQVVLLDEAQLTREPEDEFTTHIVRGDKRKRPHLVALGSGAHKERQQRLFLCGEVVEHELELLAVVGHVVCFATDEVGTTFADTEYLVSYELGLLGPAACLQQVAGHHIGGLEPERIRGVRGVREV